MPVIFSVPFLVWLSHVVLGEDGLFSSKGARLSLVVQDFYFFCRAFAGTIFLLMVWSPLAKWFCLSSSRYSRGLQPHVPQMDSWDRTGFYLMILLLRSFGRARSSLVFYVWLALLDLEVMG